MIELVAPARVPPFNEKTVEIPQLLSVEHIADILEFQMILEGPLDSPVAARADVVKHVAPTQVQALRKPVEIPPWQIAQHITETLAIQMGFHWSVSGAGERPTHS